MAGGALDGLRVVEFTDEIGSYCGRLLADLGAEVFKVEPPGGGRERNMPPYIDSLGQGPNTSLAFWVHNTSKKSVALDLDSAEGRAQAKKLAQTADIVLEDCPVGYLSARGLGYDDLRAAKPSLVYTSVTGFGQSGPHAGYAYSDIVGQAMGGMMTLAGEQADPPNMIYGNQANISASIHAAQGTLMAVLHAEATGEGQRVDVSVQEAVSKNQETAMETWDMQKRNRVRTGELGMLPVRLPAAGGYETKDGGHVFLYILAPAGVDFPEFVEWMTERGMAEDLNDEPYRSICAQLTMGMITQLMSNPNAVTEVFPHLPHIDAVVARFAKSMTAKEAYEAGQLRRNLAGIVSSPKDLAENTQLRARDWYVKLEAAPGKTIEFPGVPYRLSETPVGIARPPRLGEHTAEVLAELG